MNRDTASYIGDAVYVDIRPEDRSIQLNTDSHHDHEARNKIFLEPAVWESLLRYVARQKEKGNL